MPSSQWLFLGFVLHFPLGAIAVDLESAYFFPQLFSCHVQPSCILRVDGVLPATQYWTRQTVASFLCNLIELALAVESKRFLVRRRLSVFPVFSGLGEADLQRGGTLLFGCMRVQHYDA